MIRYVYLNLPQRPGRRRWMELQCRLHRLGAHRIEALGPNEGREILPDSRLDLGELGINATWVTMLSDLAGQGVLDEHEWLIVLEDDVLLAPLLANRVEALLARVPADTVLVQLGHLTPGSWRPGRSAKKNLRKKAGYLRTRVRNQRQSTPRNDPELVSQLEWGSHVLAIRGATALQVVERLRSRDQVTDVAFRAWASDEPGRLLRYRGQLGWQLPFPSDIVGARQRRSKPRSPASGSSTV